MRRSDGKHRKRPGRRYRARWREYPSDPRRSATSPAGATPSTSSTPSGGDLTQVCTSILRAAGLLFQEYAERWRSVQVHRPGTAAQVESYLRLHAYPYLGLRQIGAIRRSDIQAWVKELTRVLAPGSVELVYRWVATILKAAVGDRLLAASTGIAITLPKGNDAAVIPLSVTEVEAMVGAVPGTGR